MPRFNVQVQKVENDAMGQVSKSAVIDGNSFPSIEHLQKMEVQSTINTEDRFPSGSHLDVIEFLLLHCFEMRYFCAHSCKVMFNRILGCPTHVLELVSIDTTSSIEGFPTSGDDIFTLRTFSSIIRSSVQADSMKSVYRPVNDR